MINCNKATYLEALSVAQTRGTPVERAKLQTVATGLFNYLEHGRQIALCTWLMVARADVRRKNALTRLDLGAQHALVEHLRVECPVFFEGMLVVEDGAPEGDRTLPPKFITL